MNFLVIGNERNLHEVKTKFGEQHQYVFSPDHKKAEQLIENSDFVFDFNLDQNPDQGSLYVNKSTRVFVNTSKISLGALFSQPKNSIKAKIFGFNGLPTFLTNEIMEVSVLHTEHHAALSATCESLGTKYLLVEDRVGLVTPRVVCMIINEAYYTVQEGTATREDIDRAMKLGTNYPYGPFEWAAKIGLSHVYEVLDAVYHDTKDERYKIAPLLKRECLIS